MSEITQPNPQSTPPAPQPRVGVGVLVKDGDTKALAGLRKGSHGAGILSLPCLRVFPQLEYSSKYDAYKFL